VEIEFTKHAKIRCLQRNIPEQWVMDLLKKIPLLQGTHERVMEKTKLVVIYQDGETTRKVITLFPQGEGYNQRVIRRNEQTKVKD
jgi:hypothetical protein